MNLNFPSIDIAFSGIVFLYFSPLPLRATNLVVEIVRKAITIWRSIQKISKIKSDYFSYKTFEKKKQFIAPKII